MARGFFRTRFSWIFSALAIFELCAGTLSRASDAAAQSTTPVEAQLIGSLDAGRLKEGAPVVAMVVMDWKSSDCHLSPGAFVHGHISAIVRHSKSTQTSSFQIAFDRVECKGAPPELPLSLVGLIGPLDGGPISEAGLGEAPPLTDVPALAMGTNNASSPLHAPAMLRSVSQASDINTFAVVVQRTRKPPSQILPGQVIDVPRTDLHVGVGADGASVISTNNRNVRLDPKTIFILKEEIGVYRSSDGKRIASVVTNDFILGQHSYAFSASGAQAAAVNSHGDCVSCAKLCT